ncbi:MAG: hypothetical protein WAN48_03135 [Actinomycetes bacterium]
MLQFVKIAAVAAFSTALCLGVTTAASASSSGAGAVITPFAFTETENFQGTIPECFSPDLVGTTVATHTVTGNFVETPSGVFVARGKDVFDYRVDFPNGMYAFGTSTGHFSFTTAGAVMVSTQGGKEPRTVYAADGTVAARVVIHAASHLTYRDLNGDEMPQANEISANVDHFFYTCH